MWGSSWVSKISVYVRVVTVLILSSNHYDILRGYVECLWGLPIPPMICNACFTLSSICPNDYIVCSQIYLFPLIVCRCSIVSIATSWHDVRIVISCVIVPIL